MILNDPYDMKDVVSQRLFGLNCSQLDEFELDLVRDEMLIHNLTK